jgi:type IV secretory pathway VirB6-like protein
MENRTIGKTQLILGVVILLLSIIGIIWSATFFDNVKRIQTLQGDNLADKQEFTIVKYSQVGIYFNLCITVLSTSIILFFISLLFITQGKANISERRR